MAWRSGGTSNTELISNLFRNGLIKSSRVKDAMLKVDRANYCPSPSTAYEDSPQLIGHRATISAPHMHASAAESLLPFLPASNARVLDIGSGSGYLTHVLAELAGDTGRVVGIEHIQELRDLGEGNVKKSEEGRLLLDKGRVQFVVGDGRKGWREGEGESDGEGWDAIHVGAAAVKVHDELVAQLRRPGRMFIPVNDANGGQGQHIWVVDKDAEGKVKSEKMYGVSYVPLTDAPGKPYI